eukprot:gene5688-5090_t
MSARGAPPLPQAELLPLMRAAPLPQPYDTDDLVEDLGADRASVLPIATFVSRARGRLARMKGAAWDTFFCDAGLWKGGSGEDRVRRYLLPLDAEVLSRAVMAAHLMKNFHEQVGVERGPDGFFRFDVSPPDGSEGPITAVCKALKACLVEGQDGGARQAAHFTVFQRCMVNLASPHPSGNVEWGILPPARFGATTTTSETA